LSVRLGLGIDKNWKDVKENEQELKELARAGASLLILVLSSCKAPNPEVVARPKPDLDLQVVKVLPKQPLNPYDLQVQDSEHNHWFPKR
jgi:hypothetical protein